jgi:Putative Flp pilus-assembly TadE/G-like
MTNGAVKMHVRTRLRPSPRRRAERGQIVPLVAIFALLLMATMALAADLGVTTAYKRSLQNVTDAAALAGAKQLPATPVLSDEQKATQVALQVVHNSFPWAVGVGSWWTPLVTAGTVSGSQVSVTVCAGMTTTTLCTANVSKGTATPFVLTVNAPPLATNIAQYRGLASDVEVIMQQQAGTYFAGFVGQGPNQDGAQSIGHHFAPNQPFPFALYSRTVIQAGNQGETIAGNIYADRYLAPQDNGHAGICAGPSTNPVTGVTSPGYIFLGYPQQDDGTPPYQNDGQSTSRGDPIIDGATCPTGSGVVGMSGNNVSAAGCSGAYTGSASGSVLSFDAADGACEANPAIQPPQVATPTPPTYSGTVCKQQGLSGASYQPGEYTCPNQGTSLVIDHPLVGGIYEVDAGSRSGGCDVTMDGTITSLPGVTFYLKGGAGICITIPSGVTITQTPFLAGTGTDPGDGRYIAYSDGVGNPSITLNQSGGGSTSGIWSIKGVILLPSGSVTINNKAALEDDGQIIVNTWNDQSGNHLNPSVSYNASVAGLQKEVLQLAE